MNLWTLTVTLIFCLRSADCWWSPWYVCWDRASSRYRPHGDVWKAPDGCNTCFCFMWAVNCSKKQCNKTRDCLYAPTNTSYRHGERFRAIDGCNFCTCINGNSLCTRKGCISPGGQSCFYSPQRLVYRHLQTFRAVDGCNTCQCNNSKITCTQTRCRSTGCKCYDTPTGRCVTPGQTFRNGCNICSCRANGYHICTLISKCY